MKLSNLKGLASNDGGRSWWETEVPSLILGDYLQIGCRCREIKKKNECMDIAPGHKSGHCREVAAIGGSTISEEVS